MKILFLIATLGFAQALPEGGMGIGQKMKENAEALKQYSYKRRTTIRIKDRTAARTDLVRYVDGKMEVAPLESPARPAGGGRGELRGRMAQKKIAKKKEEMKKETEQLTSLVRSYLGGGAESKGLLEKVAISRVGSGPDADIKLTASGVVSPSDSLSLVWSVAGRRPAQVEIRAAVEGKPVGVTVEYASLPQGPFYAARTTIAMPKKDLTITIDAFDYVH
ncbi:MAG: hypothetical protein LAO79_13990 [Acidobacteriia bacterium]|nr:hypothetical protein [Terriglobia bacterium]